MSTYQLGFIGTGNMGGALAQAAAKSGADMLLSNRTAAKAEALAAKLGCRDESGDRRILQLHLSRRQAADAPGTAGGTESATFDSEGQICACLHGSGHYD